jgi:tellurite resistance protein
VTTDQKPDGADETVLSGFDLLAWATCGFVADKAIDDRERQVLRQLAAKQRMPQPVLSGLIDSATGRPTRRADTGRAWMQQPTDVARLDGRVQSEERAMLVQLGAGTGMAAADVNRLINKRRSERFRQVRSQSNDAPQSAGRGSIRATLLEAFCRVMVANRKASKSERDATVEIPSKVGAPLSAPEVDKSIADFVSRVKQSGLRDILQRCADEMSLCTTAEPAHAHVFLRALKMLALADGVVHQNEKRVIRRLLDACGEPNGS